MLSPSPPIFRDGRFHPQFLFRDRLRWQSFDDLIPLPRLDTFALKTNIRKRTRTFFSRLAFSSLFFLSISYRFSHVFSPRVRSRPPFTL